MRDYVIAVINLLLENDGRANNNVIKSVVSEYVNPRSVDREWRRHNQYIKDEPLIRGIVILPVDKDWVMNPEDYEVEAWAQGIVRRHIPEVTRINNVMGIPKYNQSEKIRQHRDEFRDLSIKYREIYKKLSDSTGIIDGDEFEEE